MRYSIETRLGPGHTRSVGHTIDTEFATPETALRAICRKHNLERGQFQDPKPYRDVSGELQGWIQTLPRFMRADTITKINIFEL